MSSTNKKLPLLRFDGSQVDSVASAFIAASNGHNDLSVPGNFEKDANLACRVFEVKPEEKPGRSSE